MWAKGFQRRKTDDEAAGVGASYQFTVCRFQINSPSLFCTSFVSIPKSNQFTNVFFFFSVQRTIEQMLRCLRLFFVLNECFFSSFDINDMHVQTIFIEDLEKPLASVNCYFGLYIKT